MLVVYPIDAFHTGKPTAIRTPLAFHSKTVIGLQVSQLFTFT